MTRIDAEPISAPVSQAGLAASADGATLCLDSRLERTQRVEFTTDALSPDNPLLAEHVANRPALVVLSPTVHRLYGTRVYEYFTRAATAPSVEYMVLRRTEATKTLDAAIDVCDRAAAAGLHRTSPIVAIGGGVCSDICGVAAAMHRRGVPHINVPTTLIGLVDAGIGLKCAVNHGGRKSALGAFHPPELTVLDRGFLSSLPRRHLVAAIAEMVKLAVVRDEVLFDALERDLEELLLTRLRNPAEAAELVVRRSVVGMLAELARNPFETGDYQRRVDLGHTFSPHIETASGYAVLHGEAVAADTALSTQIAVALGVLDAADGERILRLLERAGLALACPQISASALWASLASVVEHRDGALNLVVPTGIGTCTYLGLDQVGPAVVEQSLDRLRERPRDRTEPDGALVRAVRSVRTAR